MEPPSLVYASFDRVPSPKGAAVHIGAFAEGLARAFGRLDLVTVGPEDLATRSAFGEGIAHHTLPALGATLIERVLHFRIRFGAWWGGRRARVAHVRSIYEGYPIALRKGQTCDALVFEVNGLPSIELKYHYPDVADDRDLVEKLRVQEQRCLDAADLVVTVSEVTAGHLESRGVDRDRIRVIRNGVDTDLFAYRPPRPWDDRPVRLLYSGTLSPWQGVGDALDAVALVNREFAATLDLVGPARPGQARALRERCHDLGIADRVRLVGPVGQDELACLHRDCDVALAPLRPDDRNLLQGCCPLKVLEAMASGTPVIASDLPVTRELARPGEEAILVRPGSAKAIKEALVLLRDLPELRTSLAESARRRVECEFTWVRAQRALAAAYEEVLGIRRATTRRSAAASTSG
jgi:glycosyltransferase involved in cell wall biosynthesis